MEHGFRQRNELMHEQLEEFNNSLKLFVHFLSRNSLSCARPAEREFAGGRNNDMGTLRS